QSSRAG
ncbi:terminase small subunit, partial [Escherichia coli 96.0428]